LRHRESFCREHGTACSMDVRYCPVLWVADIVDADPDPTSVGDPNP
jgi:hypothetical protein